MKNRYEFIFLYDVLSGNPNGDPDSGNLPRIDAETGHGVVTDVCLKRKIRNFVQLSKPESQGVNVGNEGLGYDIYVREKAVLNLQHQRAYDALSIKPKVDAPEPKPADAPKGKKSTKRNSVQGDGKEVDAARGWMCRNFFDVRTFGAVMGTGTAKCGNVRGPVQITFSRSIDPIDIHQHAITRMAVTTEEKSKEQNGGNRGFGTKYTVPYALYRAHGFVSANDAATSGFSEEDLELLWNSLEMMFEHDRSASRGEMTPRALIIFKHDSSLGNAPAHALFDRVTVDRKSKDTSARAFSDYEILFDRKPIEETVSVGADVNVRQGVTMIRRF